MKSTATHFFRWWMLCFCLLPRTETLAGDNDSAGQDYVIKVWGADDGLTEGSVTDVAQTPEGYLWVGTLFGSVLRFDGTRFVSYNSANTPEFSLKWGVPRLKADTDGTLWITMIDGGITTWDKHGFRSVRTSASKLDHLLYSAPERAVFVDLDGQLLAGQKHGEHWDWLTVTLPDVLPQQQGQHCADATGRVWYLRGENEIGNWDGQATNRVTPPAGWEGQKIRVLTADSQGRIWIGTDRMLAAWATNHFEVMTPTNGEAVLNVRRIIPSCSSNLWVEANGRMRRCIGREWLGESAGWSSELLAKKIAIRFVHGDQEGGLWAGAGDLGLIHVALDGGVRRLTTLDGLPSNAIHFAYEDHDGDIWTGYERGGLVQVRRRLFRSIGKDAGLGDSLINTVSEDATGAVWIGTHSGVVGRYSNGICTNIVLPGPARAVQDSCVAGDVQGRVWIGAQGVGLLRSEAGRMQLIANQAQFDNLPPRLLLPARDGRLWVGTLYSIFSVSNEVVTPEYKYKTVGDHPTALAEAADGTIWVGTLDGALLRREGGQFIRLEPPDRGSLGRIWALWPAADGGLWAGTEQGGLLHWTKGNYFRYTMKNGLPSDSISQVMCDVQGNLWLGTRAGIVRILGAALDRFEHGEMDVVPVSVYGQPDGLLTIGSAIIDQPNCWRGGDGTLLFAMANSVAVVSPGQVHINPLPPAVALEEMWADDQRVWPGRTGAILTGTEVSSGKNRTVTPPEIEIGPGRGDLEFHYAGLSLGSPLRVRFKYRLAGLENVWNDAGVERKAIYRHVPPGEYFFRVIACNSDGIFNQESDLLAVKINPHFYETVWFRGATALAAILGLSLTVALFMRQRLRRRMAQMEQQHELERERSRIAQDLHDDLGAGLTEISLLGGMLQDPERFSARKQEALQRIVQRCHDLVVALDEIVWAVNPRNDSVKSVVSYLSRYAQGFLEPTTIRCRLEVSEAEPEHPLNSEQRHNLFLAFKEALTNLVRHSAATEVRIKISFEGKKLLFISIEDNGRGLPVAANAERGEGLKNLSRRMTQIGGQCEFGSPPGGGVAITLILPLTGIG